MSYGRGFHFNQTLKLPFIYHHYVVYGQPKRQKYGNLTKAMTDTFKVCSYLFHPCQFYFISYFHILFYFLFLILPQ